MTTPDSPGGGDDRDGRLTPEQRRKRRRRLAEVFGEDLPEQTSDDRDRPGEPDGADAAAREEWLRRQVPPHHG